MVCSHVCCRVRCIFYDGLRNVDSSRNGDSISNRIRLCQVEILEHYRVLSAYGYMSFGYDTSFSVGITFNVLVVSIC